MATSAATMVIATSSGATTTTRTTPSWSMVGGRYCLMSAKWMTHVAQKRMREQPRRPRKIVAEKKSWGAAQNREEEHKPLKRMESDVRVDCSNNQIKFRSPRLMVQRTKSSSSTSSPALANAKARDLVVYTHSWIVGEPVWRWDLNCWIWVGKVYIERLKNTPCRPCSLFVNNWERICGERDPSIHPSTIWSGWIHLSTSFGGWVGLGKVLLMKPTRQWLCRMGMTWAFHRRKLSLVSVRQNSWEYTWPQGKDLEWRKKGQRWWKRPLY